MTKPIKDLPFTRNDMAELAERMRTKCRTTQERLTQIELEHKLFKENRELREEAKELADCFEMCLYWLGGNSKTTKYLAWKAEKHWDDYFGKPNKKKPPKVSADVKEEAEHIFKIMIRGWDLSRKHKS